MLRDVSTERFHLWPTRFHWHMIRASLKRSEATKMWKAHSQAINTCFASPSKGARHNYSERQHRRMVFSALPNTTFIYFAS